MPTTATVVAMPANALSCLSVILLSSRNAWEELRVA
jgi:hypothetical protein